jgi:hypothetical protein
MMRNSNAAGLKPGKSSHPEGLQSASPVSDPLLQA